MSISNREPELKRRATSVLPNGIYGHLSVSLLPDGYPQFFSRAQGPYVWDVNNKCYLDFMCSFGPQILGHHCPAVEKAVEAQRALGDTMSGPSELMVELAERLVKTISGADWCLFAKNGNDVTTLAVLIARACTGKKKILIQPRAYHGASAIWTKGAPGVLVEEHMHQLHFKWNDLGSVEEAVNVAKDDLAAIIVSPFDYTWGKDLSLPSSEFVKGVREMCDRTGCLLILDDVRAGFRLNMSGSWTSYGVHADLSCYSKAIANGYSLAALVGVRKTKKAAESIFATGSFWYSAVSFAAALATLEELERTNAIQVMRQIGSLFCEGLRSQALKHGFDVVVSGPPQMPWLSFVDDSRDLMEHSQPRGSPLDRPRARLFCQKAVSKGVYLHPYHNWFISAAMTKADIEFALNVTNQAFEAVRSRYRIPSRM